MKLYMSARNPDGQNIEITKEELAKIRRLSDFDLTMLLSQLEDFGWQRSIPQDPTGHLGARALLPEIPERQ